MQPILMLNKPQFEFIKSHNKFMAFVGGYRSGKTFVGCVRMCINALEFPGIPQGYFAPTYPQITDIFYDTLPGVAEAFGLFADIVASNKRVYLRDKKGRCLSTIVCKSMEHPHRIVGFNIAHALVDEIDCMPIKKADSAWKKIIARMSTVWPGRDMNTIDVTTTPEGFNWVYRKFVKELASDPTQRQFYGIVHASTRQNAKNLPKDYIPSLRKSYPAGSGFGSVREVTAFVEISQITDVATSGGDQQFLTFGFLADDDDRQLPTTKNPISMAVTVADDPDLPYVAVVEAADEDKVARVLRLNLPNGDSILYNAYVTITSTPALARNNLMTRVITISLAGRPTRYSAVVA